MMPNVVDELCYTLNFEIARELLFEQKPNISEDEVKEIYEKCNGNPYDAPIMFKLLQIVGGKI